MTTREEWEADAERHVRHACYPQQRVSDQLDHWTSAEERAHLAHIARQARLGAGRAVKVLEDADGWHRINDVQAQLADMYRLLRKWECVIGRVEAAAGEALEKAIRDEIARRKTDGAWAKQQAWEAALDADRMPGGTR